ncbi:hypothetical protein [uncultured Christiangramia sp.]|uniref:hypothetical protein n=1 Tax=uncultured Christiangramia sp. TaxID=503836 RepID=UPI0025DB5822|nr:hypothetical protein [uncultured Christiangramia sp.]
MTHRSENPNSETDHNHDEFEDNNITELIPALYSKRVIFMFCLLFSTIFGAVILMSNLNSLKENKGKWQVLLFALLYTAGHAYTVFNFSTTYIGLMLNLGGALFLTEYFWNRYIGMEREFIRKSWTKPAIVSALITVPLIVAAVLTTQ